MQTYETVRQVINDINLMNNRFMNKALDGNIPATQTILRIILDNDKIKVISVTVQRFLQNLYGHSAQLDILADSVGYFKNTKEGEVDMTDIIELYAENKARKAAEAAAEKATKDAEQAERISFAKKMLKNNESIDKIVLYSALSADEVRALAAKLSA